MSLDDYLRQETDRLSRSWMQYDEQMLRDYLVAGVEDPRINVQSVLTRHFLIVALFGRQFDEMLEQELRFAIVVNWLRKILEGLGSNEDLKAVHHALAIGADNAEGIAIPQFASSTFTTLPRTANGVHIPNYLERILDPGSAETPEDLLENEILPTFQIAWNKALEPASPSGVSVLEPACGSANDYRFLDAFGLARLIDYSGFDLCEKNIRNAKTLFPQARFAVGNVLDIDASDAAFDYCVVHDLFEHLSLQAMGKALDEICRVTRQGLCLGFFNIYEGDEHIVRPVDDYHCNTLSLPRLKETIERQRFEVRVVHIGTFLKWRFGCGETHNQNAYTLFAHRDSIADHPHPRPPLHGELRVVGGPPCCSRSGTNSTRSARTVTRGIENRMT